MTRTGTAGTPSPSPSRSAATAALRASRRASSGTYGGPDGGAVSIGGSCTDGAGNAGSSSLTIKYDATPPEVTAAPERQPDAAGWYNHAVKVVFTGKDGGSGIAQCTDPVTYGGPDANPAKIVGQCRDAAGHLSAPTTLELTLRRHQARRARTCGPRIAGPRSRSPGPARRTSSARS